MPQSQIKHAEHRPKRYAHHRSGSGIGINFGHCLIQVLHGLAENRAARCKLVLADTDDSIGQNQSQHEFSKRLDHL